MSLDIKMQTMRQAVNAGHLRRKTKAELLDYGDMLCHSQAYAHFGTHEFPALRDAVQMAILVKALEEIDERNRYLQYMMAFVGICSLFAALVQIYFSTKECEATPATPTLAEHRSAQKMPPPVPPRKAQ